MKFSIFGFLRSRNACKKFNKLYVRHTTTTTVCTNSHNNNNCCVGNYCNNNNNIQRRRQQHVFFSSTTTLLRSLTTSSSGTCFVQKHTCRSLTTNNSSQQSQSSFIATRVRFAPSPTGDLHLGGLRTALYNYLFARQRNGVFVLRCEDTDQARLVPGAMQRLIDLLTWMGIKPDEGPTIGGPHGPYIQSERLDIYQKWVERLLETGHAYRCFCSPTRLELLRKEQMRRRETFYGYDNACRDLTEDKVEQKLSSGTPYSIRFKLKNEAQQWRDVVHGECTADLTHAEGDPIILKSDGYPTYHLANVVDDHLMHISHVLRGAEWQSSTAKHLQLYEAFDWTPPTFAHLPLLLNEDGTKLSKRQDSMRLQWLKDQGYEAESIISLLSLAGGGIVVPHQTVNDEGVSLARAVECFDLKKTRTESTVLAIQRLPALNQSHVARCYKQLSKESFCDKVQEIATSKGLGSIQMSKLYKNFEKYSDRVHTLNDLFDGEFQFLWKPPNSDLSSVYKRVKGVTAEDCVKVLFALKAAVNSESSISNEELLQSVQRKMTLKKSHVFKIIRIAITGNEVGTPVVLLLDLLSSGEITTRCDDAVKQLEHGV